MFITAREMGNLGIYVAKPIVPSVGNFIETKALALFKNIN